MMQTIIYAFHLYNNETIPALELQSSRLPRFRPDAT